MKLFTKSILNQLTQAGYNNMKPICKLFTPWKNCTWLITGIQDGVLYGYADLNMGCVEHGGIATIEDFESIRGPFQMKVERDRYFTPKEGVNYLEMDSLVGI